MLARSRDSLVNVSRRITLGNTENCTGRSTWIAVNNTRTDAAMLAVKSRSNTKLGMGTSNTKIMHTAANGTAQSPSPWRNLIMSFDFILD